MCGIAGWKCFGKKRPSADTVRELLLEIEHRGKDATGIGWLDGKTLCVLKKAVTAERFVRKGKFVEIMNNPPPVCIMHTRAKTQGHESNNKNNHPVFGKSGIGVTHNGMIRNYEELKKKHGFTMDAQVDSEVILKLLESGTGWWKSIKRLEELTGSYAIAAINAERPNELILARSGSPLAVGFDKENKILYWASEADAISDALTEREMGFIVNTPVAPYRLVDDVAILVTEAGLAEKARVVAKTWAVTTTTYAGKGGPDKLCEGCQTKAYRLYDAKEDGDDEGWQLCHKCYKEMTGKTWCFHCSDFTEKENNGVCKLCKKFGNSWH